MMQKVKVKYIGNILKEINFYTDFTAEIKVKAGDIIEVDEESYKKELKYNTEWELVKEQEPKKTKKESD